MIEQSLVMAIPASLSTLLPCIRAAEGDALPEICLLCLYRASARLMTMKVW